LKKVDTIKGFQTRNMICLKRKEAENGMPTICWQNPYTKHIVNLKLKHISDVNFREKLKHVDDVNFREKRKHVYDVCQFQRIVLVRLSAFLYTK
jgi:hypothetical protein